MDIENKKVASSYVDLQLPISPIEFFRESPNF